MSTPVFPARVSFTVPQIGPVYDAQQIRTALTGITRAIPPMVTRTTTVDTTIAATDDTLLVDTTSGNITVTLLPANQVQFLRVQIKNTGTNTVTVSGTVDGSANVALSSSGVLSIQSDGSEWRRLGPNIWRYNVLDFGARTNGDDATAAFQLASNAALATRGSITVFDGDYVIATGVTFGSGVGYNAQSINARLIHSPTTDGTICVNFTTGTNAQCVKNVVRNLCIYSPDTTHVKTAVRFTDVSSLDVDEIFITGAGSGTPSAPYYCDPTNASVCIQTMGRENSSITNVRACGNYPVRISANPNTQRTAGEDSDHMHWSNLYLVGLGHYNITVDDGIGLMETRFDGYQPWVGGTGGFIMNDTRVSPQVGSRGISFTGVRGEQCTDPTGYWFNISAVQPIQNLKITQCIGAATAQGITVTRCLQLVLDTVEMTMSGGKDSLRVSGGFGSSTIDMVGCFWQPGSVFTLTGYTASEIRAYDPSAMAGPASATYVDTSRLKNGVTNTGLLTSYVSDGVTTYRALTTNQYGTYIGDGVCNGADDFLHVERTTPGGSTGILVFNRSETALADAFIHFFGGAQDVTGSDLRIASQSGAAGGENNIVASCNSLATNPNASFNLINSSNAGVTIYTGNAKSVVFPYGGALVNQLSLRGGLLASTVNIAALGSDTNVGISYDAKGTGGHFFRAGAGASVSLFSADATNGFKVQTTKFGVYSATPVVQPTVTGSRGGNAALASVLTALASQGLLIDSTTV